MVLILRGGECACLGASAKEGLGGGCWGSVKDQKPAGRIILLLFVEGLQFFECRSIIK